MIKKKRQIVRYVVGDWLATSLAWFVFNIIRFTDVVEPANGAPDLTLGAFLLITPVILGQILFPVGMLGIYYLSGYYNRPFFKSRIEEFITTFSTALIGSLIIYFIAIIDDPIPDRASNYELLAMLFGLLFSMVYLTRLSITGFATKKVHRGELVFPTLIVGTGPDALTLYNRLTHPRNRPTGYKVVGFAAYPGVADAPATIEGLPVVRLDDIAEEMPRLGATHIALTIHPDGLDATLRTIHGLYGLNAPVLISPTLFNLLTPKRRLSDVAGEPLCDITGPSVGQSTLNLKRAGDVVVSALVLLALMPVFAIVAIAIKRDSDGPVFYRQERVGYRKRPFRILKFRTMRSDAESGGPRLSAKDDPRITPVGRFLRKYRIDELPQFWNVLKGDMSIVGPRPEREFFINQILPKAPYYALVHQVRPGITSWGMVKHGYASSVDEMVDRLQYDLIYLDNISFLVDLKILFYTVNTVVTGKGV